MQLLVVSWVIGLGACGGTSDATTDGADQAPTTVAGTDASEAATETTPDSTTAGPTSETATSSAINDGSWPTEIEDAVRACTALLRDGTATILEYRATADAAKIDAISLACGPATLNLVQLGGEAAEEAATELTVAGDDFYDEVDDPNAEVDDWEARADAIDALIP